MPSTEVAPVVSLWGTMELLLARVARLSSRLSPIALILQLLNSGLHVCVTGSMDMSRDCGATTVRDPSTCLCLI